MEVPEAAVTLSSRRQIVIPREVREQLRINPGQKPGLITLGGRVAMPEYLRSLGRGILRRPLSLARRMRATSRPRREG